MATGALITVSGVTKQEYDKVMELLNFDAKPQPGLIFHCAGQGAGEWTVFDVWESQEAFERFQRERLAPVFEKAGIQARPHAEFFPIHNTYLADAKALSTRARAAGR